MSSNDPSNEDEISLSDLMPAGFPIDDTPGEDIVAVPESIDEKKQLEEMADISEKGEVLPPLPATSVLSTEMLQAAHADATGFKLNEIAKAVGVTEASVKQWRLRPEYKAEVARLANENIMKLDLPLQNVYHNLIVATNEAISTLQLGLNAVDDKGRPSWPTRLRAAEKLLDHGIELGKSGTITGKDPGGARNVDKSGAVVIVIKD